VLWPGPAVLRGLLLVAFCCGWLAGCCLGPRCRGGVVGRRSVLSLGSGLRSDPVGRRIPGLSGLGGLRLVGRCGVLLGGLVRLLPALLGRTRFLLTLPHSYLVGGGALVVGGWVYCWFLWLDPVWRPRKVLGLAAPLPPFQCSTLSGRVKGALRRRLAAMGRRRSPPLTGRMISTRLPVPDRDPTLD
jgi:hypothetical protein